MLKTSPYTEADSSLSRLTPHTEESLFFLTTISSKGDPATNIEDSILALRTESLH